MLQKWPILFYLFFLTSFTLTFGDSSKDSHRFKRATASCNTGWTEVGNYCYKVANVTTYSFHSFDIACALMNSTMSTFPTLQDYQDFYNYWLTFPGPPNVVIGYKHFKGVAAYSDIVSGYSEQPIPYPSQFCGGEPSMNPGEWCVHLVGSRKCLNDLACTNPSLVPVCQQRKTYDPTVSNVSCAPVCQAKTTSGHMYAVTLQYMCNGQGTIENATVAYTLNQYIPGMTEFVVDMKSASGNSLMVYGQQGVMAVSATYSYVSSFLVATVKTSASMNEYILMKNPQGTDTLICQTNSSLCQNLTSQSWSPQATFYMFDQMDNYVCDICTWGEWQPLTPCDAACGYGNETRIRYKTGSAGYCQGNETESQECFLTPCKQGCSYNWEEVGNYCYQMPTNVTTFSLNSFMAACAAMNGTLPTFLTRQDFDDFLTQWSTLPSSPRFMVGYIHLVGVAGLADMVNCYSDQKIPWLPTPYKSGEPNMMGSEWCSVVVASTGLNDFTCNAQGNVPMCQQRKNFDDTVTANASCSPLCQSRTTSGHRFTTSASKCDLQATVENSTVAYAMTEFIPGISDEIFEVKSSSGNTLMVYGQQGLAALNSSYLNNINSQRSFIVSTIKTSTNTELFSLWINPEHNDTLICQNNGPVCQNASSNGWTMQHSFYLFVSMNTSTYTCDFCDWTDWQQLTPCNATCGNGTETKIRFRTGSLHVCSGNETTSLDCYLSICPDTCSPGWTDAGRFCYQTVTPVSGKVFENYATSCAEQNGTLVTFPTQSDYQSFFDYWQTLPGPPRCILGYVHGAGFASLADIFNAYNAQNIPWNTPFLPTDPNYINSNEWCTTMWLGSGGSKGVVDISCQNSYVSSTPMCQQMKSYAPEITADVPCSPLCESKTKKGHIYTTNSALCKKQATVLNDTVAYALTSFIPDLTDMIYWVQTSNGAMLMIYGQAAFDALNSSYTLESSFIVASVKVANNLAEFNLMINPQGNDTVICQTGSTQCQNLSSQSWKVQNSFFMFTAMDNYVCNFCNWTDWTNLTHCDAPCGYGNETIIRFEICHGVINNETNQTMIAECIIVPCVYEQKTCQAKNEGIVNATMVVPSILECVDGCTDSGWCMGVNYTPPNGTTPNCEWLWTSTAPGPTICDVDWNFYERV